MSDMSVKTLDEKKKRRIYAAFAIFGIVAVIVLIIGLTLSWFVESNRQSTVGKIEPPAEIKVLGPNATAMEEIDLAYMASDYPDHRVNLTRTFSVVSGSNFTLQLAHTTNIQDLEIKLYRVDAKDSASSAEYVSVDGDGKPIYWSRSGKNLYASSQGKFINSANEGNTLAKDLDGGPIFGGKPVQENAIPLYWELEKVKPDDKYTNKYLDANNQPCHVTNFIIDLSWTDSAKETDVLYLIARS